MPTGASGAGVKEEPVNGGRVVNAKFVRGWFCSEYQQQQTGQDETDAAGVEAMVDDQSGRPCSPVETTPLMI